MQSDLRDARGLTAVLSQNRIEQEDFEDGVTGFRDDYEGIGVYIFRNAFRNDKWYVMTLQN